MLGVSMSLGGVNELQLGFLERRSAEAFYLADACANEGILRLKQDADSGYTSYSGGDLNHMLDSDEECSITVTSPDASTRIIQTTGTRSGTITRKIEVTVDISTGFSVTSWQEQGNF